jgi:hypothetical protein
MRAALSSNAGPMNVVSSQEESFAMTPQQFWCRGYALGAWIPFAGDADGDGHADLMALSPNGACTINLDRASALGKLTSGGGVAALENFGNNAVGVVCGPFARKAPAADVLGIFEDGSVRLAWGIAPGTTRFEHNDVVCQIPTGFLAKGPVKAAVADFEAGGKADALLVDGEGKLVLLQNASIAGGQPKFAAYPIKTKLPGIRQLAAGVIAGNAHGLAIWLDGSGSVFKAAIEHKEDGSFDLGAATLVIKASPDDHIAVAHFRGLKPADILVGQRLLTGGNPNAVTILHDVPPTEIAKDDYVWAAADVDGNGKDDLIRFRRGPEPWVGDDTYVHFSYDSADPDHGYYCTANDGLPDFWKVGHLKPGGLDLAALGCKVGHRDIVLEIDRFDNVDEKSLRANMDRAARYYASLPIKNPDGTTGIALHFIYNKPWPIKDHDKIMGNFDDRFPPVEHRGIVHAAFAENNGPLVSKYCGDNSHFNGGWHEFLHEFGHQMDLSHEGYWETQACPLFPSLMNYSYSYSVGDDGEKAGYSDGSFRSFVIHPLHLPKRLPFPYEKLKYLSGGPYHFRVKPGADGKSTYVDWNWNGLFDDVEVSACVNYSHGIYMENRFAMGKSQTAPVLVAHGGRDKSTILLICGHSTTHASKLTIRSWLGKDRDADFSHWLDEVTIEESGVLGDATATYLGSGLTWVAYQTSSGVVLRSISVDADGRPQVGPPRLVPLSVGAQPTLAAFDDRLALLLWRSRTDPVGLRLLRGNGTNVTMVPEAKFDFFSEVPVGAVGGLNGSDGPSMWVTRIEGGTSARRGHTEAIRLVLGPDRVLREAERSFLDGQYATHRMTLLWQKEPGLLPQGRLYQFAGGMTSPNKPWSEQFITINVPYKEVGGGWLIKRYDQPNYTSLSAPGACFYDGNIVYALRRFLPNSDQDDSVEICFYGSGANRTPEGDFDDIGHIRDIGLTRSIQCVAR